MNDILKAHVSTLATVFETESLTALYDPDTCTIWNSMHAHPRPCFSVALLRDLLEVYGHIRRGAWKVDFCVVRSAVPQVFNLGGDLHYIRDCSLREDWAGLAEYARLCVEAIYGMVSGLDRRVISIAEISGDTLGGGFEAALSCDFMIAEQGTRLGFPEVLFNLFPGMGAYSLLARKLAPQVAQRMILSGAIAQSETLHAQGLLDKVVAPGHGREAVERFILDTRKQLGGYKGFLEGRRRSTLWPTHAELMNVVGHWVECVKQISPRDLRLIDRLVSAQNRLKPAEAAEEAGRSPMRPRSVAFRGTADPGSPAPAGSSLEPPVVAPEVFQVSGRFPGGFLAVQPGHQVQRHIDTRRNAGRGQDLPVIKKSPVSVHRSRGSKFTQQLELQIVGGDLQAVE